MEKYDLIIVGAGPAGIFTAVELLRHGSKKKMLLVEKGKPVEKRHCPKAEVGHCVNCRPTCAITTGFSGAGAFSDGKLSLSYEVGGDLPTLIGEEFAQKLIDYTDKIYLEFGADPHVEGIYTGEDIKEIRKNAIHAGLKLVDCPIRHLGTEKAQQLYLAIQNYLADNGVEMLFSTECENIILENEECKGVFIKGPKDEEAHAVYADTVVIGTGRRGADWLEKICAEHHIAHKPGTVDIGVRVECRNEVMEKINQVLYEGKLIGYNTDGVGFYTSLVEEGKINVEESTFFCFGAGGAGRAMCSVLAYHGAKKIYITDFYEPCAESLVMDINENFAPVAELVHHGDYAKIAECNVVMNASGIGMGSTIGQTPMPVEHIQPGQFYFDACYNPDKTQFLLNAEEKGCQVLNGLGMSLYQGAAQIELWTGEKAPVEAMRKELMDILAESK